MRLDKWLWAARFFKTRSLAQQALVGGRVQLNGERTKPAHEVKVGDRVEVRVSEWRWEVKVKALSERRGPAEEARKLYDETEASRAERSRLSDLRRWGAEPSAALKGRPTKRDRRQIDDFTAPGDDT
jgi:ribosome-associated heat shock protein Hsp15